MKKCFAVPLSLSLVLPAAAQPRPEDPVFPAAAPQPPATAVSPADSPAGSPGSPGMPPEASSGTVSDLPPAPPAVTPRQVTRIGAPGVSGGLVQPLSKEPVDFDFKDADLLGILRTFATKVDRNIIAGPGVGGKVTLRLKAVPFDDAFRILLDQVGLVAVQKSGNIIEVVRASALPALVEIFPLKYRFALEVQKTVQDMLRERPEEKRKPVIAVDAASNSLIVTAENDVLQQIRQLIDQIDINSPQISIKARLIEVSAGSSLNWGVTWAGATRFGTNGTVRSMNNMSNYTINTANSTTDGRPADVDVRQAPTFFPTGGIIDVSTVMNKTRVYALLNAIMSDNHSKTISEPTVLTGNNKSAKIHVGQNLPVRTSQTTQTATTQSVQYIPEGVDLEVTPVVSPGSDVISFRIRVGISELVGFQDNNPITTERTATTEVSVRSEDTVVIGGLMREKTIDTESGIPILKDIPILGWLFKSKKKSKDKTELLIFITPEIVNQTARL